MKAYLRVLKKSYLREGVFYTDDMRSFARLHKKQIFELYEDPMKKDFYRIKSFDYSFDYRVFIWHKNWLRESNLDKDGQYQLNFGG